MPTLSSRKALSFRRLTAYRVIDPTGITVGKITDATIGKHHGVESLSVYLFGCGRTIGFSWQDIVISPEKQTVLVLPEWGTTVP